MTLFVIPESWEWTTLGEVAEVVGGVTKDSKKQADPDLPLVPYLRVANVQRGFLDLRTVAEIRVPEATLNKLRLISGDVLLNEGGDRDKLGRGWVWQGEIPDCIHQNHVFRARPNQEVIEPKLLALFANELGRAWFDKNATQSVNLASISLNKIKQLPVPIPPRAEQSRILQALEGHLSHFDAAMQIVTKSLNRLQSFEREIFRKAVTGNLVQTVPDQHGASAVHIALTQRAKRVSKRRQTPRQASLKPAPQMPTHWTVASIDELCWDIEYGTSAKSSDQKMVDDIPVIRMGNIRDGRIQLNNLKYLPKTHSDLPRLMLTDGDVLFNRTNSAELVGKAAVYRSRLGPATFASYLIRCRPVEEIEPDWINLVINSPFGRSYIKTVAAQQVGQANVSGSKFASMPIPVPPSTERRRILDAVETVRHNLAPLELSLNRIQAQASRLRRSLLTEAFAGRLVPQDPGDEPASVLLERIKAERAAQVKAPRQRRTRKKVEAEGALW